MAKELYLYSPVYDFVVESLVSQLEENTDNEVIIRCNTPGGDVFAGYALCAKMQEHGNVTIKVDGNASSIGSMALLYAKKVECLDVSTFVLHRANMCVETPEQQSFLDKINKDLKSKYLQRFDKDTFKEVTDTSIEEMFNPEKRIDIILDAKQAKRLGLVQKINKLTPAEVDAFNIRFKVAALDESQEKLNNLINKKMDLATLKASHPSVFAEVSLIGATQEKERIEAWTHFIEVDAKMVKEGIASGKPITQAQIIDLMEKKLSAKSTKELEDDSTKEKLDTGNKIVLTGEAKKQAEMAAWKAEVLAESTILAPEAK